MPRTSVSLQLITVQFIDLTLENADMYSRSLLFSSSFLGGAMLSSTFSFTVFDLG